MLVIGNGESRLQVTIKSIEESKIGCNAIHRDFTVDHLICIDRRMVQEALEKEVHLSCNLYTRTEWGYDFLTIDNLHPVPKLPYSGNERWDEPLQWGSGPYAVLLGAILDKQVKLLGFDLYGHGTSINNIYKGTQGYDPADKNAVDPKYWIYQISKVFDCFPEVDFTIYQPQGWQIPESWIKPNVSLDNISKLL